MRPRSSCLWLTVLALLSPCLAAPARAEAEAQGAAQADELLVKEGFRTAEALRRAGDLTGALSVLRWTYERVRTPFLLWPMAELSLPLQQPLGGLEALEEYAAKLPPGEQPDPGQPGAAAVSKLREQLRRQLAHLSVGTDEPGALLILDGRQLGRAPLPAPLDLDPGRHRLEARGSREARLDLVLGPGEARRVTLPVAGRSKEPDRRVDVAARFVLLGLGVAALVSGSALMGLDAACSAGEGCTSDLRTPGAALLGVGAGVLGAAGVLIGLEVRRAGGGRGGLRQALGHF